MLRSLSDKSQPAPWQLSEFNRDEAFWTRFGTRLNPEDARDWPEQQIRDWYLIMSAEAEHQDREANRQTQNNAGSQAPADTEAAFQAMKRRRAEKQQEACGG